MYIVIWGLLIIIFIALILLLLDDMSDGHTGSVVGVIVIGFFLAINVCVLLKSWNQDINPTSIKYYKMQNKLLEDGTSAQVAVIEDEDIIFNVTRRHSKIFPPDSIVYKYRYISRKGWVHWMNGGVNRFEIILPTDEKYKEAKENIEKPTIK